MSISILLVDDLGVVRKGLRYLIEKEPDLKVVGEAGDSLTALKMAREMSPDLVVMDWTMPEMNGVEATRRIKAERSKTHVLGLSLDADSRFVARMLDAGAGGYLLKQSAEQELIRAIREIVSGKLYLCPGVSSAVADAYRNRHADSVSPTTQLSAREHEVLQLIAEGYSTKQIAERLLVSNKTVWSHGENVKHKLRIQSVAGLTKFAIREGITSLTG